MKPELRQAMREDFLLFARKAFKTLNPGDQLVLHPYIYHLCHQLELLSRGSIRRLNINLPPRHAKTFICSKAFAAWMLGRNPSTKILIVTGSESLARDIAFDIRELLLTEWYQQIFKTRIRHNRIGVFDFATTDGGACFSAPVGSSFTGKGGTLLITDDLIDISDALDVEKIKWVANIFDSKIGTRLNNHQTGLMLNVAQRLNSNDLAGVLLRRPEWSNVVLPFVATRSQTFRLKSGKWRRVKGELLQKGSFTPKQIKQLQENLLEPDFETLYQQNPGGELAARIRAADFSSHASEMDLASAVVLSADAAQHASSTSSFSVVQAWARRGGSHFLIDQFRAQVEFDELFKAVRRFRRKYRPHAILVERTALGVPVLSEGRKRGWKELVTITPDGRSKAARLRPHVRAIRAGGISLPVGAEWREDFVREFVNFPNGDTTDQVDSATQYLEWIEGRPDLPPPSPRAIGAVAFGRRRFW